MSDITLTFSKDQYIYGEDKLIEGKITISAEKLSELKGDIVVKHIIKEGIFGKIINSDNLEELLKPARFFAVTNPFSTIDTYTLSTSKLKKHEIHFQFDITTPNFYGDMGVPEGDGEYSCIVNYISVTVDELNISEVFPVRIEWESAQSALLQKKKDKEVIDEDDFDEEEEKYDVSKGIKVLWGERLISQSAYDDVSNFSPIQKIGKWLYEMKLFWILYRTLWIGALPFFIFSVSEFIVTFLPQYNTTSINNVYLGSTIFFLFLRFFFVSGFKRVMNSRSVALDLYEPNDNEEEYFRECFRGNSLKLKNLFDPEYGDPLYPINVNGKCEIGMRLWYEYTIGKNNTVEQDIINKNIFKCSFSSLGSFMEKEIPLEKWVNEVASIKNEHEHLVCEVTIDITYTGLTKERETITLFGY